MLQRIQTLYMLVAVLLLGLMFVFPVSYFGGTTFSANFFVCGIKPSLGDLPFSLGGLWVPTAILVLLICALLLAVSRYRNRIHQIKILMVSVLLCISLIGILFYFNDKIEKMDVVFGQVEYRLGAFLPIMVLLLILMSNRAIKKDEAKVRAANRLR